MNPDELKWFDDQVQQYENDLGIYKEYASALTNALEPAATRICPTAIVTARPKGVASFAKKLLLKKDQYRISAKQPTDLCGARVIVQLLSEVDAVCRFIREEFEIDKANSLDVKDRLTATSFGYRAVHFVVQFKPDSHLARTIPANTLKEILPLKAEIQVRTIGQHAWADIGHDRLYKNSLFKAPEHLERESARLAAVFESADEAFSRLVEGIDAYRADYGGYDNEQVLRETIDRLQAVRKYAAGDEDLVHQLARLLICLQRWDEVIALVENPAGPKSARLLTCLGYALCKKNDKERGTHYEKGRAFLEQVAREAPAAVEAHVRLAESWIGIDRKKVLLHYAAAFSADPTDPQALCGYARYKVAEEKNLAFLDLLKPSILAAIKKCRSQAAVRMNLPWAYYHMAELNLLLGEHELESLNCYIQAVAATPATSPFILEQALAAVQTLEPVENQLPAATTARLLLLLARATRFNASDRPIKELFTPPVVIVAGGCDPAVQKQMEGYRALLATAFAGYEGTIVSGGTREGISGMVGELADLYKPRIIAVGYLPKSLPADGTATRDTRYRVLRNTTGRDDFSALEPLQSWIDIVGSGIDPATVRVLAINGGQITAFEARLAAMLGARVAVVRDSGREAGTLAREAEWQQIHGLTVLPPDRMTLQAFISAGGPSLLEAAQREAMAQKIHEDFLERNPPVAKPAEPVQQPWNILPPEHKKSNLEAADDYARKLAAIGKTFVPVRDRPIVCCKLSDDEIKLLAEMEHGRYVAQKLLEGWTLGPRDDVKKQRPSLVGWEQLGAEKEKDIDAVRLIPALLRDMGYEIQPAV